MDSALTEEQEDTLTRVFRTLQDRYCVEGFLTEATSRDWLRCVAAFVRRRPVADVAAPPEEVPSSVEDEGTKNIYYYGK